MGKLNRIILLASARTYRNHPFLEAAKRLGLEVVKGRDVPLPMLNKIDRGLPLDYRDIRKSTEAIVRYTEKTPVCAIIGLDDSGTLLAANASAALGLPHNSPQAALAARNKYVMRQRFAEAGVPSPNFRLYGANDDPEIIADEIQSATERGLVQRPHPFGGETWFRTLRASSSTTGADASTAASPANAFARSASAQHAAPSAQGANGGVRYPCVLKPTTLSGSRGVMRADGPEEFVQRFERLRRILFGERCEEVLVEDYIPGIEVSVEGLLDGGRLQVLALFDKPDPLEGPFFEETIYVTPSRLPPETQSAIFEATAKAAAALGLHTGPIHAELRVNERGPWLLEVAARSIGGMCSKTLRFGTDMSLEELILRQALGMEIDTQREKRAGGVMMIPIPQAGLLRAMHGEEEARAVPLIESIEITASLNYPLLPLPEGDSYFGFIFARGETPESVEAALREAHRKLRFDIAEEIPVLAHP